MPVVEPDEVPAPDAGSPAGGSPAGGWPAGGSPDVESTDQRRRAIGRRAVIALSVVAVLVVGAGTAYATGVFRSSGTQFRAGASTAAKAPASASPPAASPSVAGSPTTAAVPPVDRTISLSATGDIIMGNAPDSLPPNDAQGLFDAVKPVLAADLQMGNLEQTLTADTGVRKCSAENAGVSCFAFRTPPTFAGALRDAGFGLMNMANNHADDFGPAGYKNTQGALDGVGIKYTGWPGQVTVVQVKGVKVAVVGFASYDWSNNVADLTAAAAIVKQAAAQADLVVVQVHMGAEGADRAHVKPGTETYYGENRGDPIAFTHAVIDAGADLVIGHGPHVLRAMEFYQGRLIAYSLGNFVGYRSLVIDGVVGVGAVLKVTLRADGTYVDGALNPTIIQSPGLPKPDPKKQAIDLVGSLSKADFPSTGAKVSAAGAITP